MSIILPWVAFALGLLWMFRQGDKAKHIYLRNKAQQQKAEEVRLRAYELMVAEAIERSKKEPHYPLAAG